jgi:N-acetylmuramoyl-L-alanine amidase
VPTIYLSPSVQDFNPYIIGGNEEYYMNRIADAMIPYLRASGIGFKRNNPNDTLSQVIAQSNSGNYDLHLALHSNVSPDNIRGVLQGPDVYFYTTNDRGRRAADMITVNLKNIYPNPSLVAAIATTTHQELSGAKVPAVLVEIAYQDNYTDATWLRDNINEIAKNLAFSVAQYLEVPFQSP